MSLKIGFDIHGVIDSNTQFFAELTQTLVKAGHEVHVLTGPKITSKITDQLKEMGIHYTHLFSITDYQESKGVDITWDEHGNPHMHAYDWDKSKAEYCETNGIQLHLDDSDTYGYFFRTPYARFYSKDTHRVKKTKL